MRLSVPSSDRHLFPRASQMRPWAKIGFSGRIHTEEHVISHTPIEFRYPSAQHPYLQSLKSTYGLQKIIQAGKDPLEKACLLNTWVNAQWEHCNRMPKQPDAMSILDEAQNSGVGFPCFAYARVLTACLNAVGIPARSVGLKSSDMETRQEGAGHVVVEGYMKHLKKWVMFDPTTGGVFTEKGIPLNVIELKNALEKTPQDVQALSMKKEWADPACIDWVLNTFLKQYLFYWNVSLDQMDTMMGTEDKPGLMYVPSGAKLPTVFQRNQPIGNMQYTDTLAEFYRPPTSLDTLT